MKRINEIDRMLGLAMILVVIGHLRGGNYVPAWYYPKFYGYIYSFHMAAFMFISAFLIRYAYKDCASWHDYRIYIGKKFTKFFIPFLLIGVIGVVAKAGISNWPDIRHGFEMLLLEPRASYSGFLWYIYLLFIFYCISPPVFYFSGRIHITLLVLSLYWVFFPLPTQILCLDHFSRFFFFYLAGVLTAEYLPQLQRIPVQWATAGALLFLGWSIYYWTYGGEPYSFTAGCLGIAAIFWLTRLLTADSTISRGLTVIGKNCFIIYLLHMFVVRGAILLGNHWAWVKNAAVIYMLVTAAAAITIPILMVWAAGWLRRKRQMQQTRG